MAIGDMAFLTGSVGTSSTFFPAMTAWTANDGTDLTSSDAVLVRSVMFNNDSTILRGGDPDGDGTFEIQFGIASEASAGEVHSLTTVYTDTARVGIQDNSGSGGDFVMIGEQIDPASVWVEQEAGVADGNSITRTIATAGTEEYVIEAGASASSEIRREVDVDDDGSFASTGDFGAIVESGVSGLLTELWLGMIYPSDRTNPAFRTPFVNQSGGQADMFMWGTIV